VSFQFLQSRGAGIYKLLSVPLAGGKMSKRIFETELMGRKLVLETGELAQFANGSVLVRYGDTTVLSTATAAEPREGFDFFPLSVDYEEKM